MPKPKVIKSYTVDYKLRVIEWHRANGKNETKTSKQFGIHRKCIHNWNLNYNNLLAHDNSRDRYKRKLSPGAPPISPDLDDQLFEFFIDERVAGRAVSNQMLVTKALAIADELKLTHFKASCGYIEKFKRRHEVSMRQGTNEGQKNPDELVDILRSWRQSINRTRTIVDYTPYEIANMDETMCRFDMPYSRTNDIRGTKTIRIKSTGHQKKGFTVALCAHANGTKRPAYVIFKEPGGKFGPRVLGALKIPANVKISASDNGWMTTARFMDWIERIWKPFEDTERHRLLFLDKYKPHYTAQANEALQQENTDVIQIPAGCTSLCQPADVSWNRPFKVHLRKLWTEWMSREENRQTTPAGNLKCPTRQDVIYWISTAWEAVTEETIIKSFLVTGIANNLDGAEDYLIQNNVEPERPELTDDEMLALFNDDSQDIDGFEGFEDQEEQVNVGASTSGTSRVPPLVYSEEDSD